MEIPVIYCRNCAKHTWSKWILVIVLWMLFSVINCQNLENSTISVIKEVHNFTSSDTKPVRTLLEDAVSSNKPVFNVLNTNSHERTDSVTMRPTHIPVGLMSQPEWTVHKNKPLLTQNTSDSSPIVGLPIALSMFKERDGTGIANTRQTDVNKKNDSSFTFSLHHEEPNAGIYIPMERLLRVRRQAQGRQGGGRVIMLRNIRPGVSRNQTRALPQSFLQVLQNNPQYNFTHSNLSNIFRTSLRPGLDHRSGGVRQGGIPGGSESKPAVQGLTDLTRIDLNLPLRPPDKPAEQTNRPINRTISTSRGQWSPNIKHHTETRRLRQSSSSTANLPRANIHTLRRGSVRSGQISPSQRTPSTSNLAAIREARQPATRLTFVQPVTGRRITPSRTSSMSSSARTSSRTPAVSSGTSRGAASVISRASGISRGAATGTLSGNGSGTSRASGTSRNIGSRTPDSVASSRTVTRVSSGTPRASVRTVSRTPTRSSTRRRITSSVQRSPPSSRTISTSVRRSRPTAVSSASSGSRSQSHRRPTSQSRSTTRRSSSTSRRTSPQQRRVAQPTRRRTPPDPFTQRFSAGFQRGSRLLHQPPIDFTSLSSNQRSAASRARTPIGQGFLNTLALSNSVPFPGLGPSLPQVPPGVFLGGGFPSML